MRPIKKQNKMEGCGIYTLKHYKVHVIFQAKKRFSLAEVVIMERLLLLLTLAPFKGDQYLDH
ncbi:hypothetical protein ACTXT7_006828 [Hymenolepis weldensis]